MPKPRRKLSSAEMMVSGNLKCLIDDQARLYKDGNPLFDLEYFIRLKEIRRTFHKAIQQKNLT